MRTAAPSLMTSLAILLIATSNAQAEIAWQKNLRSAHAQAQAEGKLLLLHFYSDNCTWCERLEKGSFQAPQVGEAISQNFVPVKIHANTSPKLAEMFKVTKFPTDVIVTTTGQTLAHSVSPQNPDRYVSMLSNSVLAAPKEAATPGAAPAPQVEVAEGESPKTASVQSSPTTPPVPNYAAAPTNTAAPSQAAAPVSAPTGTPAMTASATQGTAAKPVSDLVLPSDISGGAKTQFAAARSQSLTLEMPGQATAPSTTSELAMPQQVIMPAAKDAESAAGAIADKTEAAVASVPALAAAAKAAIENEAIEKEAEAAAAKEQAIAASIPAVSNQVAVSSAPATQAPAATTTATSVPADLEQPELAMQGFCPVTVITEDKWVEGKPDFGVIHLGKLYLFTSKENMQTFLADPVPFTPVLNEIDVVRFFEERKIVPGKREWGLKDPIYNRMFFFADEAAMEHFYNEYERYTDAAVKVMEKAVKDANPGT